MVKTRCSTSVSLVKFPRSVLKFSICLFLFAIFLVGCGTTSKDRIAAYQTAISSAQAVSAEADSYSAQLDEVIAQSEATIAAGLPAEQADSLLEKIAKAKAVKATVIAYKQAAMLQAAKCQATIDELVASGREDFGAELEAIGSIVTGAGATVPPPVGTWLALIGTLMGVSGAAVGRVYGKNKATAAAEPYVIASKEIIEGNEKSLAIMPAKLAEAVKAVWESAQITPTTRLIVKEVTE